MFKIELFSLNWVTALWRYYLLMAVAIVAGFSGQYWLGALCLPIFISAITGMRITRTQKVEVAKEAKVVPMERKERKGKQIAS